ncbi:FAD binding domain-containing protein [Ancylobacter defluvii]|uniref:FAD-binding molybdopterin dehydrogenase n=1 Tax=Ancylobacter defluvii TaxID=1282440 RepID=A0A9W6JVJ5_9HYPH|nr:FAD binding domain-containing protein [Ancylobacter defluvii]MBS7590485.1 FAD binding domain-containing protein [Ancylobacter defluvii]GLK83406.1 FAD-binding molybdopterin dehydrogenase [Ancylobacter defluvii]
MDINTVTEVLRPRARDEIAAARPGDAFLGGGTFLFSEPQPELRRLIDLSKLRWAPLSAGDAGLDIAATCTIAELHAFEAPAGWTAAALIGECCRAFLASFKVWNMATVGGNICLGLPAGPMISLAAALDASCVLWAGDGGERRLPVLDFVRGPRENALAPGELLRRIELPAAALARRFAFRRASLTPLGRSGVLVIGTLDRDGSLRLTVTAATRRPQRLDFPAPLDRAALAARLAAELPPALYYDDVHGRPDWRRHMTQLFAEEIRAELLGEAA